LTAVQLLWVNLIQDTLAALALATDPPTLELLDRKPEPKGSSLISFNMWKMIFGQSVVQLAVTIVLDFGGTAVFPSSWDTTTRKTIVFNTFVWLQIFNEINCRRLDNKINVFSGIHRNVYFIVIIVIMVSCQTLIILVGGAAFSVTRLNSQQWFICIALGFLSLPAGAIIRILPNDFIKTFIPKRILRERTYVDQERQIEDWEDAVEVIRDDLMFFKRVRGERRLGSIGNNYKGYGSIQLPPTEDQSETRRTSGPDESLGTSSPHESSRVPPSQLYSVNNASTLVPGLVALSMAVPYSDELPPVAGTSHAPHQESSALLQI
jgi:Ca2+-transporting ATPase